MQITSSGAEANPVDREDAAHFLNPDSQDLPPSPSQAKEPSSEGNVVRFGRPVENVNKVSTEIGKCQTEDPDGDGCKEIRNTKWSQEVIVQLDRDSCFKRFLLHLGTYFSRLHTLKICGSANTSSLKLLYWEDQELIKGEKLGARAVQVICWRRTLLEVSCFCYFCNVFFTSMRLFRSALGDYKEFGDGKVFGMEMGDYASHFAGYVVAEYFFQGATLAAHGLAFIFCIVGYQRWRTWSTSFSKTGIAYGLGYLAPFILLLVIPFHLGIDIKGLRTQFCNEVVDGASAYVEDRSSPYSWPAGKLLETLKRSNLPGMDKFGSFDNTSSYGLRSFLASFDISLPSTEEFCSFDADIWDQYVTSLIEAAGRLAYENGTCPAVQEVSASLQKHADTGKQTASDAALNASEAMKVAVATCEAAPCDVCGSDTCLALLPTFQVAIASAYSYALALNSSGGEIPTSIPPDTAVALATWGMDAYAPASACYNCMTGSPACAALCLPLWASGEASYIAGSISTEAVKQLNSAYAQAKQLEQWSWDQAQESLSRFCIRNSHLTGLKVLVALGTSTRAFQTLLGFKFSIRALGTLLPITFAMMLGAFKGACIAKTVVPYSRIPGIIIISAVAFSMPHLATLVIIIKSIFGDMLILVALCCFLAANMVYLPAGVLLNTLGLNVLVTNGIIEPDTSDGAVTTMLRRQRYALILNILFAVLLVIWFFAAAPLEEFMALGFVDVDFADVRNYIGSDEFWKTLSVTGIDLFTKMYGLTKISQVFFFDMSLFAILLTDETDNSERDASFRKEHGRKEVELLRELHTSLFPNDGLGPCELMDTE